MESLAFVLFPSGIKPLRAVPAHLFFSAQAPRQIPANAAFDRQPEEAGLAWGGALSLSGAGRKRPFRFRCRAEAAAAACAGGLSTLREHEG